MSAMKMKDEGGGSIIEFAIISPLLFVAVFGVIELGVLLYDKAVLTNASREGARAGTVYDTALRDDNGGVNYSAVEDAVYDAVDDYIDFLISVSGPVSLGPPEVVPENGGKSLRVTLTYPFRFLVFSNVLALLGGSVGNLVTLKAETVMRFE